MNLAELTGRARAAVAEARATREVNREVRATAAALLADFVALLRRSAWLAQRLDMRGDGCDGQGVRELALRQNVMREVNERIHRLRWAPADGDQIGYVCECSLVECAETIPLDGAAYEGVRASPVRFLLLPGHESPQVERIVERRRAYTVVENVGEAAEVARGDTPASV